MSWKTVVISCFTVLLAACGGGGGSADPDENDPGPPVGLTFKAVLSSSHEASVVEAIAGPELDPAYGMRRGAAETRLVKAKAASELAAGELFAYNWVSVVKRGQTPVAGVAQGPFTEGDSIDLYVNYEAAAGAELNRLWHLAGAGLDFEETGVVHDSAGVYEAKFQYQLPYSLEATASTAPAGGLSLGFQSDQTPLGEIVHYPSHGGTSQAQMVWEDMNSGSDYDYNDFVAKMHVIETRNMDDQLVEIEFLVKALARGAGYMHNWQFNLAAAFPGAHVICVVDQYYDDGDGNVNDERHGPQRVWTSDDGTSVPVFEPTKQAIPPADDGGNYSNVVAGTTYVEGDYAIVKMTLDPPLSQGVYTPIPYEPELVVHPGQNSSYILGLWRQPGDPVDVNGRPLGFIVPTTWAWPLESKKIWNVYPPFDAWVEWINDQSLPQPVPAWYETDPVKDYFDRSLFKTHGEGGGDDV